MGVITEGITRLCDEILNLRQGRRSLNAALAHGNADRKNAVTELCAGFARVRAETARQAHAARHAFMKNLSQGVHRHRREMRADLMGARRAWMGKRA